MEDEKFVQEAIANPTLPICCAQLHSESCNKKAIEQFFNASSSLSKLYLAAHLIPLLFRRKELASKPLQVFWRFLSGYFKSLLSVGLNSALIRRLVCTAWFGFDGHYTIPQGFVSGVALLIESPSRRAEIALYCAAKSIEMGYSVLLRRGLVRSIPKGEAFLFGLAIAIIGYFCQHEPQAVKKAYLSGFQLLIGRV